MTIVPGPPPWRYGAGHPRHAPMTMFVARFVARRLPLRLCLAVALVSCAGLAHGQEAGAKPAWSRIESMDETKLYQQEARTGALGEQSLAWLRDTVVPQLAAEGNRATIERTRRRIRDVFLNERIFDAASLEAANRVMVPALVGLAMRDGSAAIVRINAMLFLGELRSKDGRPLPAALEPLAAALADAKLPAGVRVAAVAGLARHAAAAREEGTADFGKVAGQAVAAVVAAPPGGDRDAADWLTSRALEMLPAVAPQPAVTAAVVKVLDDGARSIDVRVRAAAALGATAGADLKPAAARVVESIRGLAFAALDDDIARAEAREFDRKLGGTAGPAAALVPDRLGGDVDVVGQESLVVRRDAWRLSQLADALARDDGRGIAGLLDGDAAAAARLLAESLRQAANTLDADPRVEALETVRADLAQPAAAAAEPAEPAENREGGPAAAKPASPFDQ